MAIDRMKTRGVCGGTKPAARKPVRWTLAGAVMVIATVMAGCGQPAGVVFPPLDTPLRWPGPPERERIRYVGQLAVSTDLKPAVSWRQAFAKAMFGRKNTYAMLTPMAVCTDGGSRVFVADSNGQVVHVFDLASRRYEQWRPSGKGGKSGEGEGEGNGKQFSQPVGIAYDPAGRLYVADSVAGLIFVFDSKGAFIGEIGEGVLARPCGLAFDAVKGRLFVADTGAHQVIVLSPAGKVLGRIGKRGTRMGEFNFPTSVALDSRGRLYVCDSLNFRVQQFTPDLKPIRQIGRKGDLPGYFARPKGLALDSKDHLYVIDAQFEAIQIFDADGRLLLTIGEEGRGPGQFWLPTGIFIDSNDRIWVADSYNRRVQVFDYQPEKNNERHMPDDSP